MDPGVQTTGGVQKQAGGGREGRQVQDEHPRGPAQGGERANPAQESDADQRSQPEVQGRV